MTDLEQFREWLEHRYDDARHKLACAETEYAAGGGDEAILTEPRRVANRYAAALNVLDDFEGK